MACSSCGKQTPMNLDANLVKTKQDLFNTGLFLPVVYTNFGTSTRLVGSPTGVIVEYNITNYGNAKPGDYLLVHKTDIEKLPNIFILLQKNSNKYKEALQKFGISEVIEAKATVVEVPNEVVPIIEITEESLDEVVEPVVVVTEIKQQPTEVFTNTNTVKKLNRSEALEMKEFQKVYGFTHHFAVRAKIKSGELFSFQKDGKTYVYHY